MVLRPLYLGKSLEELQAKAVLADLSKLSTKSLCIASDKVYKEAKQKNEQYDEEHAYVLFFKYIHLIKAIFTRQDYKKDAKYFEDMYGCKKKMKTAVEKLEELDTSLANRYQERTRNLLKAKDLSVVNGTAGKLPPIQDSQDKENVKPTDLITFKELHSLIQQKSTTFLILDTRSLKDYQASHIKHPYSLNIPETVLRPGVTASAIENGISISSRDQWRRRSNMDKLIICDWQSNQFEPGPVSYLKAAMTDWDPSTKYEGEIRLLKGGYEMFRLGYPLFVTDSKVRAPQVTRPREETEIPSLAGVDYPDLDKAFIKTPADSFSATPSPPPAKITTSAITITRGTIPTTGGGGVGGGGGGGVATASYPSLSNLNSGLSSLTSSSSHQPPSAAAAAANYGSTPRVDRSAKPKAAGGGGIGAARRRVDGRDDGAVNGGSGGPATTEDEMNNARLMSGLSLNSTGSLSALNNAMLSDSSNNATTSINGHSYDTTTTMDNASTVSRGLNTGMILGPTTTTTTTPPPKVDRSQKEAVRLRYEDKMKRARVTAASSRDITEVMASRKELADLSWEREIEALKRETEWAKIRASREEAAGAEMRELLIEKTQKLEEEIEIARNKYIEKEENEERLKQELEELSEKLRKQERNEKEAKEARMAEEEIRQRQREKERLMVEVERKRKERRQRQELEVLRQGERQREEKLLEERRRQEEAERRAGGRRGGREAEEDETPVRRRERLKDDSTPSSGGGLRRSYSSPNIAQLIDAEGREARKNVPAPKFDRQKKPSGIIKRDFAGVWGTTKPGLTGLRNLGNTCYMNSILQCVSNTAPLVNYFVSGKYEEDINDRSETRGEVAREFAALLSNLWYGQYKSISPSNLKLTVGRYKHEFSGREQQDSHEFASKLLEWLHDDTNKIQKPNKMPEIDTTNMSDAQAAGKQWKTYIERNQSIIVQLFCGQTRQSIRCLSCGATSIKYQEFNNLTLPIPTNSSSRVSLSECFQHFLREEKVDWSCEKCKVKSFAVRKMDIVKLPPLLVIQLERFYPDTQMGRCDEVKYRKKQNFVSFDTNNLDIGSFALHGKGIDNKYSTFSLYAVSNHFGTLEGGHYTAYCHSDVSKRWHKYDDQDVSQIDASDVVTPAAYILFLSAIEGKTSLHPLG